MAIKDDSLLDCPASDDNQLPSSNDCLTNDVIQPSKLVFQSCNEFKVKQFEEELYLLLKKRVEQVRLCESKDFRHTETAIPQRTKWNLTIGEKVRTDLLMTLESFCYKINTSSVGNAIGEDFKNQSLVDLRNFKSKIMLAIGAEKTFYGVPLKFNHIDQEKIWKAVRDTEFFDRIHEDSELVMVVACFPYPGCLNSVWVFVGSVGEDWQN